MSNQSRVTADQILSGVRQTYQSVPPDDTSRQRLVIKLAAGLLDLEHDDYKDLVHHLVTADQVDEDAYRWATSGGDSAPRSTVPEGSQGGGWNVSTTSGWSGSQI